MSQSPTILLRASWAFGNIGDIAITPGMLRLIEQHIPGARIILHPANSHEQIQTYIADRFPDVELVGGNVGHLDQPITPDLKQAFEESDLYLHASGPNIAYGHRMYDGPVIHDGWRGYDWASAMRPILHYYMAREMGVPFGGYGLGINFMAPPSELIFKSILNDAAFFYTRETDSLQYAKSCGINPAIMDFVPDCTFAFDMRDEAGADQLMDEYKLEEGKFLVVILRSSALRFTTEEREAKHCYQLRALIKHWIDRTGLPVFLCPETRKDVEPTGRLLHEPLPAKYKQLTRYYDKFWMPCLATSIYQRAHSMLTMDHHSAIMSLSVGTPTLHPRDPMAGRKGQIYNDLDLGDWLFDINHTVTSDIQPALDDLIDQPDHARSRVSKAMTKVNQLQADAMKVVRNVAMGQNVSVNA
ncbi:MAG: polysaccharide pyruvyl transferase family protein [Phycisphaeraceae bacterium JB051]